mmetsp:Transcript_17094/g.35874  ORF Transcript_17094/g.35874 Transcript_17094/m.35874 type:complete len:91 (+) Transcript_17094:1065-1337(+)
MALGSALTGYTSRSKPTKSTTCECSFQIISPQTTPPPQYFIPVPVSATPINVTVTAQTTGGNMRLMNLPGTSEKHNSKMAQTMLVPSILP